MTCAHCQGLESMFDRREARRSLARYRRRGPAKTTAALVEALKTEGVNGATVLDIGGGVGAVPQALLDAGAASSAGVDASGAYVEVAREEAERRGRADRISVRHGDFVALAAEVAEADIVTLDRVICCYPDAKALLSLSAAHARCAFGLVFPRDTWWARVGVRFINVVLFVLRNPMRTFVHPTALVDELLRAAGFARRFQKVYFFWQVVVWARAAGHPPAKNA